jgi:hypothetical protein
MSEVLKMRRALRERFGARASFILRWQLRIASQCDSPALRSIIAGNIKRMGGK